MTVPKFTFEGGGVDLRLSTARHSYEKNLTT
jgi:hypothetical protein